MTEPATQSPPLQRCRQLLPTGHQCRAAALRGLEKCYVHDRDLRRSRNLTTPSARLDIPLLDSHAAIQAVCTDVARALAIGSLDIPTARQIGAILNIAARTLPRPQPAPSPSRREPHQAAAAPAAAPSPDPEPVADITLTPHGEELAPPTPYEPPAARKERTWSFAEYLYRQAYPDRIHEPLPEEGYVDPEKGPSSHRHPPRPQETNHPAPPTQPQPEPQPPANPEPTSETPPNHQPNPGIIPELQSQAEVTLSAANEVEAPVLRAVILSAAQPSRSTGLQRCHPERSEAESKDLRFSTQATTCCRTNRIGYLQLRSKGIKYLCGENQTTIAK